jgi:hypothetical protein
LVGAGHLGVDVCGLLCVRGGEFGFCVCEFALEGGLEFGFFGAVACAVVV